MRRMSRGSHPIAFSIDHDGFRLDIALVELDRLLVHEETIPELLETLRRDLQEHGVFTSPIVADRETLVVLDGMHRTKVAHDLGCRFMCVCLVDYSDPRIIVDRWCRTIPKPFDKGRTLEAVEDLGLKVSQDGSCGSQHAPLLSFRDSRFTLKTGGDLLSAFRKAYEFELELKRSGCRVGHMGEAEAARMLKRGEVEAVLCPPKIGKEDVIAVARSGRVFAPKATRHVLPARPVDVNVPISVLQDPLPTLEEANEALSSRLKEMVIRRIPAGSFWEGRRYDEVLYVFEEA